MSDDYDSRVPPEAVSIVKSGEVERIPGNENTEMFEVKDYTVSMTTNVRAYNCTCRFGSVHGDKDGVCKHVAAVELFKMLSYINEDVFEDLKGEYDDE